MTECQTDHIVITVADDGLGCNVDATRNAGRGLGNLQRRAAEVGGEVAITPKPGETQVQIRLPIERRERARQA